MSDKGMARNPRNALGAHAEIQTRIIA